MKKVLATLLAVLLLTCVFGTVASAASAPEPTMSDFKKHGYGVWFTLVSTHGKTTVYEYEHIELDKSTVEKPSDSEIESFLNNTYVADPPKFRFICVGGSYTALNIWVPHLHTELWPMGASDHCKPGLEKGSNYTCDDGSWKVVENNGNVVKAQWQCPYQPNGKHDIFITITYKPAHTHTPGTWTTVKEATCTEKGKKVQKCTGCGETLDSKEIPVDPDKHPTNMLVANQDCCEYHEDSN